MKKRKDICTSFFFFFLAGVEVGVGELLFRGLLVSHKCLITNLNSYLAECMSHHNIHICRVAAPRARIVYVPSRHDY